MRVIERSSFPHLNRAVCPECGCTIEYDEEEDIEQLENGMGFYCPDCLTEICLEPFSTHQFPKAFHKFAGKNTKILSDEETQNLIDKVAKDLQEAKIGDYCSRATGDTLVVGVKFSSEDVIQVAKGYYEESYNFRD